MGQHGHENFQVPRMQRLFFDFPGGRAGIALLLLRTVLGIALLFQGIFYFGEPKAQATVGLAGVVSLAAGALLVLGWMTPIIGFVVAGGAFAIALGVLPSALQGLLDTGLAIVFAITISLALILIGPGAFSLDARVFGRREIIIPPSFETPE
jgi:hypothetical protein